MLHVFGIYSALSSEVLAIFGEICTHGLLYSVGRLPDRATDRGAYKKPKVQKMTGITGLFEPYSSAIIEYGHVIWFCLALIIYHQTWNLILFRHYVRVAVGLPEGRGFDSHPGCHLFFCLI